MKKALVWLLLFDSLWGMVEVVFGGSLYNINVPGAALVSLILWSVGRLTS